MRQIAGVELVLTASEPPMSFADRIRHCNSYDPARAMPLWAGGIGSAGCAATTPRCCARHRQGVRRSKLTAPAVAAKATADTVSRAVDEVVEELVAERRMPKWRNETFDVAPRWGERPMFRLDRGAVPFFGVRAYGVHVNGYRRDGDRYSLWIGRRAANKQVAPGKLDNLVAGGIGNGYGAAATLAKEAEEEAAIGPS